MKPAAFRYARPETLEHALALLDEYGDEAKVLAGGQSLVPAMNFRLAVPSVLIDLGQVPELQIVDMTEGELIVGACVTQRRLERLPALHAHPLVRAALPWVGHAQTRSRGTVGGSLAHADPAAELPAVALALDVSLIATSSSGSRSISASGFFEGPFMTALEPTEILTSVAFDRRPESLACCHEIARRHGDFAIAGVAVDATVPSGTTTIESIRIAAFGVSSNPVRLRATEGALAGFGLGADAIRIAASTAAEELDHVTDDIAATETYRREALGVLAARAIASIARDEQACSAALPMKSSSLSSDTP